VRGHQGRFFLRAHVALSCWCVLVVRQTGGRGTATSGARMECGVLPLSGGSAPPTERQPFFVFSGSVFTSRALFSTTSPPRHRRQHRQGAALGRQSRRQLLLDGRMGSVAFVATATDDLDALHVAAELGIKGAATYGGISEAGAPPPTSWNAGTFVISQEEQQQCMSGPICTECARTARKRTIGALVFLRIFENPEETLDYSLLWATLPHETTEKGRISQENGESRFCTNLAVGEPMARQCH